MKKLYLAVIFLFSLSAQAQNLMLNGNFEQKNSCPSAIDNINTCTGWGTLTASPATPDYFNACATDPTVGIPVNYAGYQVPTSGNAYAGIITYTTSANYKEYLLHTITPLTIGVRYQLSMSVNLAGGAGYSTADLGAVFYQKGQPLRSSVGASQIAIAPHVSFARYNNIDDTLNWVRVDGTFVADSAYNHIVIGGFGAAAATRPRATGHGNVDLYNAAYYYIDSIVLVPDIDVFVTPFTDSIYCVGDSILIPYTVESNRYTSLNNFTLEMSDASGSFASPLILGVYNFDTSGTIHGRIPANTPVGTGYLLRIRSSDHADLSLPSKAISITNDPISKPVGSSNSPVCTGNTIFFNASTGTPGVKYAWTGPRAFNNADPNASIKLATVLDAGTYVITAYIAGCTASDTVEVNVVHVIGTVDIASDTTACQNDTLALKGHVIGKALAYSWTGPNGYTSATKDSSILHAPLSASGQYIFKGDFGGCSSSDTLNIRVEPSPQNVTAIADKPNPLCVGGSLLLTGSATGTGLTQQWDGPGGYTTLSPQAFIDTLQVSNSGNYVFTARIDGCNVRDTIAVVVNPLPPRPEALSNSPLLTGDALMLKNNKSAQGVSYQWTGPDGFSSTDAAPVVDNFTSAKIGIYVLNATQDGCTASDSVSVVLNKNTDPVVVYPNPSNGNFSVHVVLKKDQTVLVDVVSSTGQVVYAATAETHNSILKLNVALKDSIDSGVYTLRICADDETKTTRMVVNRTR